MLTNIAHLVKLQFFRVQISQFFVTMSSKSERKCVREKKVLNNGHTDKTVLMNFVKQANYRDRMKKSSNKKDALKKYTRPT